MDDRLLEFCGGVTLMNRYSGREVFLSDVHGDARDILLNRLCDGEYSGRAVADPEYVNGETEYPDHNLVYDYQINILIRDQETNADVRLWELPREMRKAVLEFSVPERPLELSYSEVLNPAAFDYEMERGSVPSKRAERIKAIESGDVHWNFATENELRVLKKCEDLEYDTARNMCAAYGMEFAFEHVVSFLDTTQLNKSDIENLIFYADLENKRDAEKERSTVEKKRKNRGR